MSSWLPASFSSCPYGNFLLCDRESRGCDAIVSLLLQKLLLQGHNVSYKVMEPFIHFRVSLEINNGQMESLNASDVKLFAVKVTPKWMGVNGMLTAGGVPLANGGVRGCFKIIQIAAPLSAAWAVCNATQLTYGSPEGPQEVLIRELEEHSLHVFIKAIKCTHTYKHTHTWVLEFVHSNTYRLLL